MSDLQGVTSCEIQRQREAHPSPLLAVRHPLIAALLSYVIRKACERAGEYAVVGRQFAVRYLKALVSNESNGQLEVKARLEHAKWTSLLSGGKRLSR